MFEIVRASSLGLLLLAAACQGKPAQAPSPAARVALTGTPAQNLVNAYLALQTRLASDDLAGAKAAFATVQTAAKPTELEVDAALRQRMLQATSDGAAASDVAHARVAFSALSDAVLTWTSTAPNPLATPLTVAHCPMALEGKGSKWLQLGEQIKNPYFGSEMLTCGDIEKTLAPGAKL